MFIQLNLSRNSAGATICIRLYSPKVNKSLSPVIKKLHLPTTAVSRTLLSSGSLKLKSLPFKGT